MLFRATYIYTYSGDAPMNARWINLLCMISQQTNTNQWPECIISTKTIFIPFAPVMRQQLVTQKSLASSPRSLKVEDNPKTTLTVLLDLFVQQTFWYNIYYIKSTGETNLFKDGSVPSSVPVSYDSEPLRQTLWPWS